MKQIIFIFTILYFSVNTFAQENYLSIHIIPGQTNSLLTSENKSVATLLEELESPVLSLNYELSFKQKRKLLFYSLSINRISYGYQVSKRKLIPSAGSEIDYTHYSTLTLVNHWGINASLGGYFKKNKNVEFGYSLGLGFSYPSSIKKGFILSA